MKGGRGGGGDEAIAPIYYSSTPNRTPQLLGVMLCSWQTRPRFFGAVMCFRACA